MFGLGGDATSLSGNCPTWPVGVTVPRSGAGNAAWTQHQHDVYGALLDAAFVLREQLDPLDSATRAFLRAAVEAATVHWPDPDQGIWEIRGPARRYLHSALMCWVALDRGIRLAELIDAQHRTQDWTITRDTIKAAILSDGWNSDVGAFTQTFGGDDLDASCLLFALVGILPPDDPRLAATIEAISAGLADDRGLLYRYRGGDDLAGEEGTFLLCTFWLVEALAVTGRLTDAEQTLHRTAAYANDLGLLAEQIDHTTGDLIGNYPQAFSHVGLILAAQAVAAATSAPSIHSSGVSDDTATAN